MVTVARMVKDKETWEHLLVRCQAANEVLSMPRFNAETFFRKRVLLETKVGVLASPKGGGWPYGGFPSHGGTPSYHRFG